MTKCELCGEPMPAGEEMLKYHGYSGDCPKPPMPRDDCGVTGRPGPLPETGWDEVPADALRRALTAAQPAQATPEPRSLREAREDAQRARMMARAAGRAPSAATADFDLPAPNDDTQQATPEPVGEVVAFAHWPLNGPPRLVWHSNKALEDAIVRSRQGHVPDMLLYAAHPAQAVPMTDDQVWHSDGIMSANGIAGFKLDALMRIVRAVEAHHGIIAQAKGGE